MRRKGWPRRKLRSRAFLVMMPPYDSQGRLTGGPRLSTSAARLDKAQDTQHWATYEVGAGGKEMRGNVTTYIGRARATLWGTIIAVVRGYRTIHSLGVSSCQYITK